MNNKLKLLLTTSAILITAPQVSAGPLDYFSSWISSSTAPRTLGNSRIEPPLPEDNFDMSLGKNNVNFKDDQLDDFDTIDFDTIEVEKNDGTKRDRDVMAFGGDQDDKAPDEGSSISQNAPISQNEGSLISKDQSTTQNKTEVASLAEIIRNPEHVTDDPFILRIRKDLELLNIENPTDNEVILRIRAQQTVRRKLNTQKRLEIERQARQVREEQARQVREEQARQVREEQDPKPSIEDQMEPIDDKYFEENFSAADIAKNDRQAAIDNRKISKLKSVKSFSKGKGALDEMRASISYMRPVGKTTDPIYINNILSSTLGSEWTETAHDDLGDLGLKSRSLGNKVVFTKGFYDEKIKKMDKNGNVEMVEPNGTYDLTKYGGKILDMLNEGNEVFMPINQSGSVFNGLGETVVNCANSIHSKLKEWELIENKEATLTRDHWVYTRLELKDGELKATLIDSTGITGALYSNQKLEDQLRALANKNALDNKKNTTFNKLEIVKRGDQGVMNHNDCGLFMTAGILKEVLDNSREALKPTEIQGTFNHINSLIGLEEFEIL